MTFEEFIKDIQTLYNNQHLTKIAITLPKEIKDYEIKIKDFDDRDNFDSDDVLHVEVDRHYCRIFIQNWKEV